MTTQHFTLRSRLADMVTTNHNLILLMPRLGIRLGFGEKSVGDICKEYGIPADFVLLVCNVYTFSDAMPSDEQIAATDMSLLLPYPQASHRYYLEERLPHVQRHLASVAVQAGERCTAILNTFFDDYRREINEHFSDEEQVIFPYLRSLSAGGKAKAGLARKFCQSHGDLVEKISDLLQILYRYIPADTDIEELNELIFTLLQLSDDFDHHAAIEERVMIPYIHMLEERSRR